jgi:ABC-2 type transport system permease protein
MNGGRVLWLAEEVTVNADSLVAGSTVALYEPLTISDMLFRYGARINPVIVQDADCMLIPLKVTNPGGEAQYVPTPWVYYPLLRPSQDHPITRNLNRVMSQFAGTVDTVGRDPRVRKRILLAGSIMGDPGLVTVTESKPTKMIVVADGDIIRNEISWEGGVPEPLTLGLDRYTMQTFGNKDFLVNCINYLVNDNGLIEMRSRELKPRLLDQARVKSQRSLWQVVNTVVPVLIIILAGVVYNALRRRHYISVK